MVLYIVDKSLIQKTPKSQVFRVKKNEYLYVSRYFGSLLVILEYSVLTLGLTCFINEFLSLFILL